MAGAFALERHFECPGCHRSFPYRGDPHLCANCVKRRLIDRLPELLEASFLNGHYEGHKFRVGGLGGEAGRSLVIELSGERAGVWFDHAAGFGGDLLDLIAAVHGDGDIGQGLHWARSWLRLPSTAPRARPRQTIANVPETIRRGFEEIWHSAEPLRRGDPVSRYLLARGIDLEVLAAVHAGRLPSSLRCHQRLWCNEARRHYPTMVGAIVDVHGRLIGVHRTSLEERSNGYVGKAPVEAPKRSLGSYRGGAIRLWRGSSGQPWRAAPADDVLALSEGIEDGLTVAQAQPAWRVAAAVSLSAMLSIVLPEQITKVVLITQNDAPGGAAQTLLRRVRARFRLECRDVWLLKPPGWTKDVNELLQLRGRS